MKINKTSPKHWIALFRFTITVIIGLVIRKFTKPPATHTIILYGHKLNGNLKALYNYISENHLTDIQTVFITIDSDYSHQLNISGVKSANANHLKTAKLIAETTCVISDHGLHSLELALYFSNIKFIDVWHGIPFKGFDEKDFRVQRKYTKIFVPSSFIAQLYTEKYGFKRESLIPTGYARTDALYNQYEDINALKYHLNIAQDKIVILFAPTWRQDHKKRSIFPFNQTEEHFFNALDIFCEKNNALIIVRTHLNSKQKKLKQYNNLIPCPHSTYPDTESILLISDMLICDWSSIAFDYLCLNRPTVFLDVQPPFTKGLSLDGSFRYGEVVKSLPELIFSLTSFIRNDTLYNQKYGIASKTITNKIYGNKLDGNSSKRCYEALIELIAKTM